MKRMNQHCKKVCGTTVYSGILLAGLVLLLGCAQPTPYPHAEALDSLGVAALAEGPIAGLSIAIAQGNELVYERGYGVTNIESGSPASSSTVYNIASTAKILSAAAVIQLVDSGRIDLNDTLGGLLPDIPHAETIGKITLRQLLNMTSGLSDYVGADLERLAVSQEPLTPAFVLDYISDRPLDYAPGSNWIYSNTGFYLVGLIVERVSDMPWGTFIIQEIARPLGLEETHLCDEVTTTRSRGYELQDGVFIPSLLDGERGVRGDAGLCSSVRDLARLPAALKNRGVISPAGLDTMIAATRLNSGLTVDYGLGISRGTFGGHTVWGHLGGSGSIVSTLAHYPDDAVTIAVLVNTRNANLGALALEGKVAEIVFELNPVLKNLPVNSGLAENLTGSYVGDRESSRYEIIYDGNSLVRVWGQDPGSKLKLLRQQGRTFGRKDWPFDQFVFQPGTGEAKAYSAYYNGFFDGFYRRVEP